MFKIKDILAHVKTRKFWTTISALMVVFGLGTYVPIVEVVGTVVTDESGMIETFEGVE